MRRPEIYMDVEESQFNHEEFTLIQEEVTGVGEWAVGPGVDSMSWPHVK